jgi:choline kinase
MLKAVILAAGMSRRLKPLTDFTPKCLLKAGNKTILGRTLDNLVANTITEVVMVTGFEEQQIIRFVTDHYPTINCRFITNTLYNETNNSFSLWLAKDEIVGHSMLLLDSDIVFEAGIIGRLLESDYHDCLALNSSHMLGEEEIKVLLDDQKRVLEISKLVDPVKAAGESIGIELFSEAGVERLFEILEHRMLAEKRVNEFYEASFEEMVRNEFNIFAVDIHPYKSMEIDTAEDLKVVNERIVPHIE